ncbi:hypothetical protein K435DRAFT_605497, partial [Dendrothele bispora CBS 962.96]
IPTWDGNTDTIVEWINDVNNFAAYSEEIQQQLGSVVPRRLRGSAKAWYYSLPPSYRSQVETNWVHVRTTIGEYYMNRKWTEDMKRKAQRAKYRESGYSRETPGEYYVRKTNLLSIVYDLDDSELISEVMEGAPPEWATILTTQSYTTAMQFQQAIRYHEHTLMELGN